MTQSLGDPGEGETRDRLIKTNLDLHFDMAKGLIMPLRQSNFDARAEPKVVFQASRGKHKVYIMICHSARVSCP